jgi:hypothetical protein
VREQGHGDSDATSVDISVILPPRSGLGLRLFTKRLVEPGALVTVTGTWHASSNRLDIALSPARPEHALHLGGAAPLAARQWRTTLVLAGIIALATAAVHYAALAKGGAIYRSLISAIAQAP